MNNALKNGFPPFLDDKGLRSAIQSVCAEFGKVKKLTILPASHVSNPNCLCLLRLDSEAAEADLCSKLDVTRFLDDLVFFADVDEKWTGPTL